MRSGLGNWAALISVTFAFGLAMSSVARAQQATLFGWVERLPPVGVNAHEPSLATLRDGRVLLSWTEEDGDGAAVRMAVLDGAGWSEARTIHRSDALFINWADFPSVVALGGGTIAAQWLQLNGAGAYQYDVNIAFSSDEGKSWTAALIPHDDRSQREHGFVSLVPDDGGGVTALWLDGRAYDSKTDGDTFENAMQVRARHINPDGTMGPESLLDARSCTCCQTSATRTGTGDIVAVYRDRTEAEIRDISVVRLTGGAWTPPVTIHDDGWEISGCPVNGPAIDAIGDDVSVIWFTGATGEPKVRIAFSEDGGARFDAPHEIGLDAPAGRMDILQLPGGDALALWIEYAGGGEAIVMCQVSRKAGCLQPQAVHINRGRESVGFPRMTRSTGGVYVAWTDSSSGTRGTTTVRVIEVTMPPKNR